MTDAAGRERQNPDRERALRALVAELRDAPNVNFKGFWIANKLEAALAAPPSQVEPLSAAAKEDAKTRSDAEYGLALDAPMPDALKAIIALAKELAESFCGGSETVHDIFCARICGLLEELTAPALAGEPLSAAPQDDVSTCPRCEGTGMYSRFPGDENRCAVCGGTGGIGSLGGPAFICKARLSADPPQDCDWPTCGCDPYADKVIEALQESGALAGEPLSADAPALTPDEIVERCAQAVRNTQMVAPCDINDKPISAYTTTRGEIVRNILALKGTFTLAPSEERLREVLRTHRYKGTSDCSCGALLQDAYTTDVALREAYIEHAVAALSELRGR